MPRDTLLDFFADFAALNEEFLVWDDGYRSHHRTYAEVARAARGFAALLFELCGFLIRESRHVQLVPACLIRPPSLRKDAGQPFETKGQSTL